MDKNVALLHDWLIGFRGGERVLETFCEMFPTANIYTLIHQPDSTSPTIEKHRIFTSSLDGFPGIGRHYRKFLPLFPLASSSLKIKEDVDVVLSSSHCVIKGVGKPPGSTHISYIHSPMRYLYDQFDSYFGSHAPLYQQLGARAFRGYLTRWDIRSNQNVDHMIANSHFVQERIRRIYNRNSEVIHPFVDLEDIAKNKTSSVLKEDFYLMVTAFAPNKRVDLAIEAFNELKKPLKIIGSGQQEQELKKKALSNVQFLGNLTRSEVIAYMQKAKGFIFPGVEDFGITPLESLACGTPVIAYKAGGVLETLTDETSTFFTAPTSSSLKQAVREFETVNFNPDSLTRRSSDFSKAHFVNKMREFMNSVTR